MGQTSTKLDSQTTQKQLRSEETDNIENCIEELQKAYHIAREALSGLSKAFPCNKNRLCDLELPINSFKEIAERLPQDKIQMMEIDQMTDFKFDIFGTQFHAICKKYINFSKDTESSKQSRNSVESIKDIIEECPICLNICRSKNVYQCKNGHIVCDQCYTKLTTKDCPTCRNEMFKTRNFVSKKLLERLPTPCQCVGCSEDELENREEECSFRLVECVYNCKTKAPFNEILVHIKSDHKIYRGNKITNTLLSCTCEGSLSMEEEHFSEDRNWVSVNLTHNGHEFFFEKFHKKDGSWYNWVCILGSQKIADKFEFIATYTDKKDGKDIIIYRGNVISIDVLRKDRPKKEGSVLLFHDFMVRKIWDGKRIDYKVTVQNK